MELTAEEKAALVAEARSSYNIGAPERASKSEITHKVYRLTVRGVWGRNRKEKYETWKLTRVPASAPLPLEEALALAREKAKELKVKSGSKWSLVEEPVKVELNTIGERTYESELYVLYSGVKLHEEVVS
jgi:hypothetical protein